jgi:putative transposase
MWPNRPPRAPSFSYRGRHRYLVTAVTRNRSRSFFDSTVASEVTSQIPPFFASRGFAVTAYCLMPDHVHLLLEGTTDDADLREAVRVWKQLVGHAWKGKTKAHLWQTGFHDRVLREGDDIRAVVRYLLNNPVRAGLVENAADYRWSSSSHYTFDELAEHAGDWKPSW